MINTKKIPGEIFFKDEYLKQKLGDRKFRDIEFHYERVINRKIPFRERVKAFITGQNKLGRSAGHLLDIITLFTPFGRHIESGREAINIILNRQQTKNNMLEKLKESSTKGALIAFAAMIAFFFGLDPEVLQLIAENAWTAGAALVIALKEAWDLFRKEKQAA